MPILVTVKKQSLDNLQLTTKQIEKVVLDSVNFAKKNNLPEFTRNTNHCTAKVSRRNSQEMDPQKSKNGRMDIGDKGKPMKHASKNENKSIKKENIDTENNFDDSLTNLQWLTGVRVNDILEGKPITYTPLSPASSNGSIDGERPYKRRHFSDSSLDYRLDDRLKPPYSYAALIIMAMKSRPSTKLTLAEIYKWISENFAYYKHADPTWQNSIRHNLSLNKCFMKIPRSKGDPGKGGYWTVVPEHANKLLETNIRKRRTSMLDYSSGDFIKKQRLDLLESQILCRIKLDLQNRLEKIVENVANKNVNNNNNLSSNNNNTNSDLNNNNINNYTQNIDNHSVSDIDENSNSSFEEKVPIQNIPDLDHCRMDHSYGKNPFSKYELSDEENIRALADSLQQTSHDIQNLLMNSQEFSALATAIRSDCIWSSNLNSSDNLTESMNKVTEELMEARNFNTDFQENSVRNDSTMVPDNTVLIGRNLNNSLNNYGNFLASPYCLSPPLSVNGDEFSEQIDASTDPPVFTNNLDLTVRGTSITLYEPTPDMISLAERNPDIKNEPLSPDI